MNWYRKAQTDDEDILGDIVKEHLESSKPVSNDVVPLSPGVKRLFMDTRAYGTAELLAIVESVDMLDPINGPITDFTIQSSQMTVSEDSSRLGEKLFDMGYRLDSTLPIQNVNVYGKKRISHPLVIMSPVGADPEVWKKKFWTQDEAVTGAKFKSKPWGKKR